jgi:hypothetical protein
MTPRLYKVRLLQPLMGQGRTKNLDVFIAMAGDELGAIAAVKRENPGAFQYQPRVSVIEYAGNSLRVFAGRVAVNKEGEVLSG